MANFRNRISELLGRLGWLRNIIAGVIGMLAGQIFVVLFELPGNFAHPAPTELMFSGDREAIWAFVQSLPLWCKVMVVSGWTIGTLSGTFVARRLTPARGSVPALVVAALFMAAILINLSMIPHPIWMAVVGIVGGLFGGLSGLLLAAPGFYCVTEERLIHAGIERVFQVISSPEGFQQAVSHITKIEYLSEQQAGAGTRFRETRLMNGREASATLEIAEYVRPNHVRMISVEGGTEWDTSFRLTAENDCVRMNMRMDARPRTILAHLMVPMILGMVRRAVAADMDAIQSYCEAEPAKPES